MNDEEINMKFENADKDARSYTDMKIRAVKNMIAPFIWMSKHLFWTVLIFLMIISAGIWISYSIRISQVIEATTGIKIFEQETINK